MKLRIIGIILVLSLLVSCSPKYESTDSSLYNGSAATGIIEQQNPQVPAVAPRVSNVPTQSKSVSVPDIKEANVNNDSSTTTDKKEITVYVTNTGEKYHTSGCSYLRKSCIPMSLSDAKSSGYTPCSRCHPPQ